VLAELTADQQAIAQRIFLRLIQFGTGQANSSRQRAMAELRAIGDEPADFDVTLEHLTRSRLVRRSAAVTTAEAGTGASDGAGPTEERVDLEHDALIFGWPWLYDLVAQRGEAERTRQQLEDKASEWVRLGRGQGGLLDEAELAEAELWLAGSDAAELGTSAALLALVAQSRAAEVAEAQRAAAADRQLRRLLAEVADPGLGSMRRSTRRAAPQRLLIGHSATDAVDFDADGSSVDDLDLDTVAATHKVEVNNLIADAQAAHLQVIQPTDSVST
jgi:hypothetical protein